MLNPAKARGVEDILSENSPGNFRFVTLPLEFPEETNFHSWKFHTKLCDIPLPWKLNSNPRSKSKTHGNSTLVEIDP